MKFIKTPLPGAFIIEMEPIEDERGFFARTWCMEEFKQKGLSTKISQCSISYNKKMGTLRGMHFQRFPHQEIKVVCCTRGLIYDVIIDLRPKSPTWKQWFAVELSSKNRKALYIPEGMAHGFQTLVDDVDVFYQISKEYYFESADGVRWNDPAFGIKWPIADVIISSRDKCYRDFE